MKLALVVPGGVDRSGVDRVVPALLWQVERLARLHTVHVFALDQEPLPAHWELLGATVHNVGRSAGRRRRFLRWFATEHQQAAFDVAHAFWSGPARYAAAAAAWHRVPLAVHVAGGEPVALHDIGYGDCCSWRGRTALRLTLRSARHVSVASHYMQRLAHDVGCRADHVPLGVALDRWPPRPPRERNPSRIPQLLHIGDLRPVKDQTTLLQAAGVLRARGVGFRLDVAGFDTMHGRMQAMAARLGIAESVRWHGVLRRDALRALTDQADVLLVTSRHDAGPLAVLEAAIAGVPTIGTPVGHIADWAPDAAVCVPFREPAALADAVERLLADEPRRLAVAREAQRRAVAMDADHTTACFERVYAAITMPRPRRFGGAMRPEA